MAKDTYKNYPKKMLANRARSWALRAAFADAIKGIASADELGDIVDITDSATVTETAVPDPKPALARGLPGEKMTISKDALAADDLGFVAELKAKAPEAIPLDTSVEACHSALTSLWKFGDAGKAEAKRILASYKLAMVSDLKGGTADDREVFLKDIENAKTKLAAAGPKL